MAWASRSGWSRFRSCSSARSMSRIWGCGGRCAARFFRWRARTARPPIAAIVLAHLVGPEAIVHGEIYSAANDRDQAAIVYKFARHMVELDHELMAMIELVPSTKTMVARRTGSVYRAVSAEAGTKHGYLPSVVIYDELAQAKNRDLYDVLDTSFGARDEPLFIVISTQSNDPEHIMSKLIDDGL